MAQISRLLLMGTSDLDDVQMQAPPSAGTPPISSSAPIPETPSTIPVNLAATTLHSQYPTVLFAILQMYCGLPTLVKIMSSPQETAIRLSLWAKESVVHRACRPRNPTQPHRGDG